MQRILAALAATLVLTACHNPRDTVITPENRDTVFKDVMASQKLSGEETRALMAAVMRLGLASAFSGQEVETVLVGKTIGQLIDDQLAWENQRQAEEREKQVAAEEARMRAEEDASQLRQIVDLRVVKKQFKPANIYASDFQDRLLFTFKATNTSSKKLRAFSGEVRFSDLFGKEIHTASVQNSTPLEGQRVLTFESALDFNPFFDNLRRLKDHRLADMQTEWRPRAVIFSDGTHIGGDE